jgi:hypothetical protein
VWYNLEKHNLLSGIPEDVIVYKTSKSSFKCSNIQMFLILFFYLPIPHPSVLPPIPSRVDTLMIFTPQPPQALLRRSGYAKARGAKFDILL